jgi:hypothetical protein
LKTCQLLNALHITHNQLVGAFRAGRLKKPQKAVTGDFVWSPAEVEAARAWFTRDRRKTPGALRKAVAP